MYTFSSDPHKKGGRYIIHVFDSFVNRKCVICFGMIAALKVCTPPGYALKGNNQEICTTKMLFPLDKARKRRYNIMKDYDEVAFVPFLWNVTPTESPALAGSGVVFA
jgi:hypothetical protein